MSRRYNKKTKYVTFSLLIAAVVIWGYIFIEHYAKTKADSNISFSIPSGFYDSPIDVELSVGSNYFLAYTLDGTEPTLASARYEGPIHIDDASDKDNVWSAKREISPFYFMPDEKSIYYIPDDKVDKCTVLRVVAFDYNGNKVSSSIHEYFVGFDKKTGYEGLYTVCINPEPLEYFDENFGIYSLGSDFRGRIDRGEYNGWSMQREGSYANFMRRGIDYERLANVEIFNPNHELILSTLCGTRVRGHGSRFYPQKTIGCYSREEYSGSDYFDCDLFGEGVGPHDFLVFSGGNDLDYKVKDYLIYRALELDDSILPATKIYPCNSFIAGEYWGPAFILEDLNAEYIARRVGVSEDNVRLLKSLEYDGDEAIAETGKDVEDWKELENYIRENDMSNVNSYSYVCSKMDVEDFANYAATQIYIGNRDWHFDNNFASWRLEKSEKNSDYADGKWRFALFDLNWSFEDDTDIAGDQYEDWDCYAMVRKLMDNSDFKKLFYSRIDELSDIFSLDNVDDILDEWSVLMEVPVEKYYSRFCNRAGVECQTKAEIERIKKYLTNRSEVVKSLF